MGPAAGGQVVGVSVGRGGLLPLLGQNFLTDSLSPDYPALKVGVWLLL